MLWLLAAIAVGFIAVERLWPAARLPRVRAWYPRVILVNSIQVGIVIVAGYTWDSWFARVSLFRIREYMGDIPSALVTYLFSTFVYYWWHRIRHESRLFWLLCHQLHHSPQRIEVLTAFYKHPVEIALNSILSAVIAFLIFGCSILAGAYYTFLTAIAEYFYHWNINTPRWLGYIVQRPDSHRVHHQYRHHTQNYADLPIWDMLFGTFKNPARFEATCGFDAWREDRFEDILAFRDLHAPGAGEKAPLHYLPTCIGCSKRWACSDSREQRSGAGRVGERRPEGSGEKLVL
ncbi:MAG TPA: sterol desaturase family protein [Candidatus Methylomirabilis sp.]|nr:sterol desaturase family protein [Candidatus Methylomirabilis sp.]